MKRMLKLYGVIGLATLLLASCGGAPLVAEAPTSASAATSAPAATAEAAAPTAVAAPSVSAPPAGYPEGYVGPVTSPKEPISAEKVTLRVVITQSADVGDWTDNAFTKWYEERTNVHIEWLVVPGDDALTKVNAMIAAGDIPDIFMNIDFSPAQLQLYGSQGLFLPLNDLIEQHGVEIKRLLTDYPQAKDILTAADGNIYSMPNLNDCYHCKDPRKLWIYKPWLDKLGLQMPTTTDEFEQVLRAFKEQDPNGNGKADEIPLMSATDSWAGSLDEFFMGSFLYSPGDPWLVLNDGKVDVPFNKPEWREGLRYLNRLYDEGLIAKESTTQTSEQLQRIANSEGEVILGAVPAGYWGVFITIDQEKGGRWSEYVTVPPLEGPGGARIAPWDHYGSVSTGTYVITTASEHPEVAFKWADGMYELEAILRSYAGVLGEDWRWAEQGELGISGEQGVWKQLVTWGADALRGRWWAQHGVQYRSSDFRLSEVTDPAKPTFEKPLYEETKNNYSPYQQDISLQLPPLYLTEDQSAQSAELATTINNYVKQMLAQFIIGEADVNDDAQWDTYTSTLDQMGIATYLKIYQDAYDAKYQQ
jgi:putative aldouronate transport system substrate-binding protein